MLKRITDKQRQALQIAIANPYMSLRDMAKELGIAHITLLDRLLPLEKKGYIERVDGKWKMTKQGSAQLLMDLALNRFKKTKR